MLRFSAEEFSAKLPWFYHGMPFDEPSDHGVFSFEVNGLDLPGDRYAVTLLLARPLDSLEVSSDGVRFEACPAHRDMIPLPPLDLSRRMISIYFRHESSPDQCPVSEVLLHTLDDSLSAARAAPLYSEYLRRTDVEASEALQRWEQFWPLLTAPGNSGADDLREMRSALEDWCERRQVLEEADPHHGAIYSEEDKYDFRDAAAAAVALTRAWRRSGYGPTRRRAEAARRYVYRGQHTEGERRGGWAHMVSGVWGGDHQVDFRRITDPLPPVDGVDTAIIINLLCEAIGCGLEPDEQDVGAIRMGAEWVQRSELRPGVFAHHEGATHDCQNSNALAAAALSRAWQTLDSLGAEPPAEWMEAALRGFEHYLEGQEAIGCWPYRFAEIGRGQRFHEQNIPDQGMGLYHFLVAAEALGMSGREDLELVLKRAARWYMCTSYIDESEPGPTIDLQYDREGGGLLFSSFTWCRFMAAASLMRISRLTDEDEPWRAFALRLMEHVRGRLWNEEDPERAPVVASSRPDIELHSWIAAAEWEAVLLGEMIDALP